MSLSSTKRLHHEVISLEEDSDKFVPYDKYYVIAITILSGKVTLKDIQGWAKMMLTYDENHQPLVTYTYGMDIFLMYSCLNEGEDHYLKGSHQKLCSKYVSIFNNLIKGDSNVECKIVEVDTQNQMFAYFSYKIFNNSQNTLIQLSNGKITLKDIVYKTSKELHSQLDRRWDDIPKIERYGVFYKFKRKKNGVAITSLSDLFDARDHKKYNAFLFS